jgi:hypothetical protein
MIIKCWVWFLIGFTIVAVIFGIVNFGMNIIIMVTVKGFYIPSWALAAITAIVMGMCVIIGFAFEKYDIQTRIQSYQNQKLNPEINKLNQISDDIKMIKQKMEII